MTKTQKTDRQKAIYAHERSAEWLTKANDARDAGKKELEAKCLSKAQYWLDRLNQLEGYNE